MCNSCCVPTEEISHYFRFPPTFTRTGSEQKFVSRNPDSNKNLPEFQSFLNLYKLKKKIVCSFNVAGGHIQFKGSMKPEDNFKFRERLF